MLQGTEERNRRMLRDPISFTQPPEGPTAVPPPEELQAR